MNFLNGRHHSTRWNGKTSQKQYINCGVVQGSVLGPILFAITFNLLQPINSDVIYLKYVDDIVIVFPSTDTKLLEQEWCNIKTWTISANLSVNVNKIKLIQFRLSK